ncbi:hypothetical protein Goarm_023082, partial [Gossypium armourianum]|nr:hypothetical protein [Gossypium armourianum]
GLGNKVLDDLVQSCSDLLGLQPYYWALRKFEPITFISLSFGLKTRIMGVGQSILESSFQYGSWLRVQLSGTAQVRGNWRNGGGWRPAPPRAIKLLCWNCRGLGNPETVRKFKQLLVDTNLDVIFLWGTKMQSNNFSRVRNQCRMDGCLEVNSTGRSGGLAMLWNP